MCVRLSLRAGAVGVFAGLAVDSKENEENDRDKDEKNPYRALAGVMETANSSCGQRNQKSDGDNESYETEKKSENGNSAENVGDYVAHDVYDHYSQIEEPEFASSCAAVKIDILLQAGCYCFFE